MFSSYVKLMFSSYVSSRRAGSDTHTQNTNTSTLTYKYSFKLGESNNFN